MAVPTAVVTNEPGSIDTTGEANGVLISINTSIPDAILQLLLYGTYTGATVLVRGRIAGMWDSGDPSLGTYAPLSAINSLTGAAAGTAGSFSLTNSTTNNFQFNVQAYDWVEVYASVLSTGAVEVAKAITPPSLSQPSILDVTVSGVSGTTGSFSTSLSLPDNSTLLFGTDNDISVTWNATLLAITQAAPNSAVKWGVSGAGIDQQFFGDTVGRDLTWDQSADSLIFNDSAILQFGTSSIATLSATGTTLSLLAATDNNTIIVGASGNAFDVKLFGADATHYITFDQSANSVKLEDSVYLGFGTNTAGVGTLGDINITWDGTDLLVAQTTADSNIKWGVSGAGINHIFYGDTATRDCSWDQTNDQLLFNDNAKLAIGTGAGGAGDVTFLWDATKLLVAQLTANSAVEWGVDGAGLDQVWYGDTASAKVTWDQSADTMIFSGVASVQGMRASTAGATAITTTRAMTLADSFGLFSVSQAAPYDIDLPSPTTGPGCVYTFYLTAAGANTVTITVAGSAATFVGTIVNDVTSVVPATGSTLTFVSGTAALGDTIIIKSISTSLYHVQAVASTNGGITIA